MNPILLCASFLIAVTACGTNITRQTLTQTQSPSTAAVVQNGASLPSTKITVAALQGEWQSTCAKSANGGNFITTLVFDDSVLKSTTVSYSDSACKTPIMLEVQITKVTLTDLTGNESKLSEMPASLTYKALTPDEAKSLNTLKTPSGTGFCGFASWATNTERSFVDPTLCNLKTNSDFKADLYGTTELDLDDCLSNDDASCTTVRYSKVSS